MARNRDIERLTARVNRLCRAVSPPRLDINVWQEGVDGEEPQLLYSTVRGRCTDSEVLEILIEGKRVGAHS